MAGLQGNVLADIPGLENLNGNAQLSNLLNLDSNSLLQNLGQNDSKHDGG